MNNGAANLAQILGSIAGSVYLWNAAGWEVLAVFVAINYATAVVVLLVKS